VIRVATLLVIGAADHREAECLRNRITHEGDGVAAAQRCLIQENVRLVGWRARHQVQHAGERRAAIECGRDPFDHFDACEIERWRLHQAEGVGLRTRER
jgi:hypothetical protein